MRTAGHDILDAEKVKTEKPFPFSKFVIFTLVLSAPNVMFLAFYIEGNDWVRKIALAAFGWLGLLPVVACIPATLAAFLFSPALPYEQRFLRAAVYILFGINALDLLFTILTTLLTTFFLI